MLGVGGASEKRRKKARTRAERPASSGEFSLRSEREAGSDSSALLSRLQTSSDQSSRKNPPLIRASSRGWQSGGGIVRATEELEGAMPSLSLV